MNKYANITTFNHRFVNNGDLTAEATICTKEESWVGITYEFINFLKACGYHPHREGFEEALDVYFGCPEQENGCDECECEF